MGAAEQTGGGAAPHGVGGVVEWGGAGETRSAPPWGGRNCRAKRGGTPPFPRQVSLGSLISLTTPLHTPPIRTRNPAGRQKMGWGGT